MLQTRQRIVRCAFYGECVMKEFVVVVYRIQDDFHGTEINLCLTAVNEDDAKQQVLRAATWADEVLEVIKLPEF